MFSKDRILAVDIGTNAVKLAVFVPGKDGLVELSTFSVESLDLAPGEELLRVSRVTATLQEMMREKGIKPGPAILCVSGKHVFSRFVKLPPVDKEKVAQIVGYEALQNVPFPIDEVVWDYQLIGSTKDQLDVMLAAIKVDIVQELTDAVTEAGLTPDIVDVAPMAFYNAARFNYPNLDGCTLLVDMGGRSTDLVFFENEQVFIRSIPVAGNAITQQIMREFDLSFEEADALKEQVGSVGLGGVHRHASDQRAEQVSKVCRSVMTRIHAEINRSVSFYRGQQHGSEPKRLLLAGGTSRLPNTDRFFRDKLNLHVETFRPFENVPIHPSVDTEDVTRNLHQLGQVVGLALRYTLTCPIEINLMPDSIKEQKAACERRPNFVVAGLAGILALVVWCSYFYKMEHLVGEKLEKVNEHVTILKRTKGKLKDLQSRLDQAQVDARRLVELEPKRTQWLRVLDEMRATVPDGMWLTSIQPDEPVRVEEGGETRVTSESGESRIQDGTLPYVQGITIAGVGWRDTVTSQAPVLRFRDELRASPLFSVETEIGSTPPPAADDMLRTFTMHLVLEDPI